MNRFVPSSTAAMDVALARLPGALRQAGFCGDVATDLASRAAMSTDNSVYQIVPGMVVAPFDAQDVGRLLSVLGQPGFSGLPITARGGGTGTNGQSLNEGVIVDFRRHMHRMLAVDVAAGWVDVEPGIVLDDLNQQLAHTGLFFSPSTSTSNRCTVGGMVGTDASGKGSRIYGKTADNVLGLTMMVGDGQTLDSQMPVPEWATPIMDEIAAACDAGRPALLANVPRLSRRFSGLDLERARPDRERLEWWRLPIGAEGTLGLITRLRLKLVKKPSQSRLCVLAFDNFSDALDATLPLLSAEPLAIEVIDEWVQRLAMEAALLDSLPAGIRGDGADRPVYAFVEFAGDDPKALDLGVAQCLAIASELTGFRGAYTTGKAGEITHLWSVRAASVGLLGGTGGRRRPISFVEDCVVPPENLSAFVHEITAILGGHGLSYGIYGHADVGCLHVRPALDIDDLADRDLYRSISDAVYEAVTAHGGIFWGEHGKGIRGEYLERFVGPEAYGAFQRIKVAFDPAGRFNPGKLIAGQTPLLGIATTPYRTTQTAPADLFAKAFACNGNALCLTYAAKTPMCPSFKVSAELRHSPKGRAEALRALEQARVAGQATEEMEADVFEALDGCLGCKSCAAGCPTHVDVPDMKSHFLERYYSKRRRPMSSLAAMLLEAHIGTLMRFRSVLRALAWTRVYGLAALGLGLIDPPLPSRHNLGHHAIEALSASEVAELPLDAGHVVLVHDPFTALFDTNSIATIAEGLRALGYAPVALSVQASGKAAYVAGARAVFVRQAKAMANALRIASSAGLPLVGLDPSLVYMLRSEYPNAGIADMPWVSAVEEFLVAELAGGRSFPSIPGANTKAVVFTHCTERSMRPAVAADWKRIFAALGLDVTVQDAGCCGMSGLFGHEARHQGWSRKLYDLSWKGSVDAADEVFATGFSCRCQVERFGSVAAAHPLALVTRRRAASGRSINTPPH
ncbi:FAD/FMN-containing dehydrogenase/Fe-S oxidoreductase [Devosia subaequoris]|uniref:FAD/FMN-containing dehydrogenase/Fe-S oxidoreductase n=1 Tax=Devosia subaequoris TaxID=395930 RepID=A0A7W6ILI0_9HYPH|nr:FAD-binding and (Fe-S)-binding domain-containing protein [Devosia subaequoris]MBB4051276.1 FAD/FMN-containing dehydrogenase/Fe-S oxidoreductase [Devosia subaequoris]MCP1211425.1 FAD-binding oxidoreductase [Devosia subaequoris]